MQVVTSGDVGGGQLVSLGIARKLVSRGASVRFVTPARGEFTRAAESVAPVDVVEENSLRDLRRVRRLSAYLRSVDASLVHTHTPVAAAILWRLAARLARVPVIHHVHTGNFYGTGFKSTVARMIDRTTARIPRSFVAVSRDTAEGIVRDGYPENRVRVIHNAITWSRQSRVEPPIGLVIGCVGRISRMKGQRELIEAFALAHEKFPIATLWIIGPVQPDEGEYFTELRARVAALGLGEAVKFWGHRDDVRDLMSRITMLVLPSFHEAFPLVLLEAMSLGVPVISTPVGGVRELVQHERTGLIVETASVDAIAAAIERIVVDDALREKITAHAYERVWSQFDEASTLDPLISLIESEAKVATRN